MHNGNLISGSMTNKFIQFIFNNNSLVKYDHWRLLRQVTSLYIKIHQLGCIDLFCCCKLYYAQYKNSGQYNKVSLVLAIRIYQGY